MAIAPGGARPLRAIDCHAHVMRRDLPLASERHSAPKRDVSVEEFLGVLDANGISHGVLTAPSFYGTDNQLLLRALAAHSDRLRGTAIVGPDTPPETLAEMAGTGVAGIRLNWFRRDTLPDVAGAGYRRLFENVRAQRWQVEIYLEGHKLAGVLPRLRESGVRVVVDHFGSPDPALGVDCAGFREVLKGVQAGDTWVKLSAPYRLGGADPQRYVDALLATGGPSQLVWASDWPFVGYEEAITYRQCVDWLVAWIPDEAVRRVVLVDTPSSLFGFGATQSGN
ncbi:MAG TPA: amidohydrolase family protein [Casimicrobiaceae bacterium]|nr:amidohydrolase family protein [Casimicrobiaceae bacterium]